MDFPDDDPHLYELLDGEPVQRNTDSIQHQRIARNVFRKLDRFVLELKNMRLCFVSRLSAHLFARSHRPLLFNRE